MSGRGEVAAIVRRDRCGERVDSYVSALSKLAVDRDVALRDDSVLIADSDAVLAVLLARLPLNTITAILVPQLADIKGWLEVVRRDCPVWTLEPPMCWPQLGR